MCYLLEVIPGVKKNHIKYNKIQGNIPMERDAEMNIRT